MRAIEDLARDYLDNYVVYHSDIDFVWFYSTEKPTRFHPEFGILPFSKLKAVPELKGIDVSLRGSSIEEDSLVVLVSSLLSYSDKYAELEVKNGEALPVKPARSYVVMSPDGEIYGAHTVDLLTGRRISENAADYGGRVHFLKALQDFAIGSDISDDEDRFMQFSFIPKNQELFFDEKAGSIPKRSQSFHDVYFNFVSYKMSEGLSAEPEFDEVIELPVNKADKKFLGMIADLADKPLFHKGVLSLNQNQSHWSRIQSQSSDLGVHRSAVGDSNFALDDLSVLAGADFERYKTQPLDQPLDTVESVDVLHEDVGTSTEAVAESINPIEISTEEILEKVEDSIAEVSSMSLMESGEEIVSDQDIFSFSEKTESSDTPSFDTRAMNFGQSTNWDGEDLEQAVESDAPEDSPISPIHTEAHVSEPSETETLPHSKPLSFAQQILAVVKANKPSSGMKV